MKGKLLVLSGVAAWLSLGPAGIEAATGRGSRRAPPPPDPISPDLATVVEGGNAFAFDLYGKLSAQPGNLFFSPAGIDTALAMTYGGAAGETAEQMAKTLHFTLAADKLHRAFWSLVALYNLPGKDREGRPLYELSVANALWGQQGYAFRPEFVRLVGENYRAGLHEVDFRQEPAARKTINDWVAKQTKDKIQDLIGPGVLNDLTRLVLTNAIYFKSRWMYPFETHATRPEPFKLSAGKSVQADMMRQQKSLRYAETDDLQVLRLPYKFNELSMIVLLPRKIDGLMALEKSLTSANWAGWTKALKTEEVDVALPKFRFTGQFALADTLKSLGMTDAFDADQADFSGMVSKDRLFISAVLHKAFVAVDEAGTEAAAATAVAMWLRAMPAAPAAAKVFRADHPFIFLIVHESSGSILFVGRMADPQG